LVGCFVGSFFGLLVKVNQTEQKTRVGRRLYNVELHYLLYLSITTLMEHPSLFTGDVDELVAHDFDLVRRTAQEKEYMLPKNLIIKLEPHGLTVHFDNLFNGNKLLGK
jgi:hypothetical protein